MPNQLVRRAAFGGISRMAYAYGGPRMVAATRLARGLQFAYRNRRTFRRGAGMARIAVQRYQRRHHKGKYSRRSAPVRKQNTRQSGSTDITSSNLVMADLTVDPIALPDSQGTGLQQRLTSSIKISGIKLCEQIVNTNAFPVRMHYAIVQLKDIKSDTAAAVASAMFRDTANATNRDLSFTDPQVSYDFRLDCFNLNPDRYYIWEHTRVTLGAFQSGAVDLALGQSPWL